MIRSHATEILDGDGLSEEVIGRSYRQLIWVNGFLGNTSAIISALRSDPEPIKRVLDVGCGHGGMLREVQRRLGVDVVGADLRPPPSGVAPFTILRGNAASDPLPEADVAISTLVAHHLSEVELAATIVNVGRSCRRFILLDLVRGRLPLMLFRIFLAPFLSPINAADGITSVRRAYTPEELGKITREALDGTAATFRHTVTPLRSRQIVDIRYR